MLQSGSAPPRLDDDPELAALLADTSAPWSGPDLQEHAPSAGLDRVAGQDFWSQDQQQVSHLRRLPVNVGM